MSSVPGRCAPCWGYDELRRHDRPHRHRALCRDASRAGDRQTARRAPPAPRPRVVQARLRCDRRDRVRAPRPVPRVHVLGCGHALRCPPAADRAGGERHLDRVAAARRAARGPPPRRPCVVPRLSRCAPGHLPRHPRRRLAPGIARALAIPAAADLERLGRCPGRRSTSPRCSACCCRR